MGLKLRLNLYYQVEARAVYGAYKAFYAARGRDFLDSGNESGEFTLHDQDQNWTALSLDAGWEWSLRRQAQLEVSRRLGCKGFLIFVYDGNYWGYEFFRSGEPLDQFVQDEEPPCGVDWFPGKSCAGNPRLLASEFPCLTENSLAAYLVRDPLWMRTHGELTDDEHEARWAEHRRLDVPARPGDEFTRFSECAVLDFLRFLGVRIELRDSYATVLAKKFRSFWVGDWRTRGDRRRPFQGRRG
jgi:hypothetical protein